MPIEKIPVVFNLGILSETEQEALQRRLTKKAKAKWETRNAKGVTDRHPFEITEEFIKHYNDTQLYEEKERRSCLAKQLLSRSKRRAALRCGGEGPRANLCLAWTEFLLLSLSCEDIQNDSLDALSDSLDQAPVGVENIPVLFYLGESVLYWLCTNSAERPDPYCYEAKMLKVGQLVFLRLFLHHILGNLTGHQTSKSHLHDFLKVLAQCELRYEPCPDLQFSAHFMMSLGHVICALSSADESPALPHAGAQGGGASLVLWFSLLSWYSAQHGIDLWSHVADDLTSLRQELCQEDWVDSCLGLMVLGEAAKLNMCCLQVLLSLPGNKSQREQAEISSQKDVWPWQLHVIYSSVLADICQHGGSAEIQKAALVGGQTSRNTAGLLSLLKKGHAEDWRVRYCAVRALDDVCDALRGDGSRRGLRNAAWLALHQHLGQELDPRVTAAVRGSEVNAIKPKKTQHDGGLRIPQSLHTVSVQNCTITWRLARGLVQCHFAPIAVPHQPCTYLKRQAPAWCHPRKETQPALKLKNSLSALRTEKTPARDSAGCGTPRQNKPHAVRTYGTYNNFYTRTDLDLMKVLEDQWQKELQMKAAEEEGAKQEAREELRRQEEEHFKEVMRKRMEKVNKDTKPYEMPR